jgi:NADH:ubiquinone oxidoreductase subunit 5 (subunit L)/multisubunit Na+/H+ antiporter MnhA subunit
MTAFYMVRLYYRTFEGDFRGWTLGRPSLLAKQEQAQHHTPDTHALDTDHEGEEDETAAPHHEEDLSQPSYPPHESPKAMTYPLIILAAFAVLAGVLNPGFHIAAQPMEHWLEPVFEAATKGAISIKEGGEALGFQLELATGGILAFAVGTGIALWMYHSQKGAPAEALSRWYMRTMNRNTTIATGAVPAGIVGLNAVAGVFGKGFLPSFYGAGFVWAALFFFGFVRLFQGLAMPKEGSDKIEVNKRPTLDDVYEALPIAAVDSLAETATAVDATIVDGLIARVTSAVVAAAGTVLRAFQNGVVHVYAAMMVLGLVIVGGFFVMPHATATVTMADPNKPATNDFKVQAGPGMGYLYRWDADNDGKPDGDWKADDDTRTIHLDPQSGKKEQLVNLEVANAFGFVGRKQIAVVAPEVTENVLR